MRPSLIGLCAVLAAGSNAVVLAQIQPPANVPIVLDADNSSLDLANNASVFHQLRITQGTTRIEAERAETEARTDFSDSEWVFAGNVRIDVGESRIEADTANLYFVNRQLKRATVDGSPARFEDRDPLTGNITRGQADTFIYDFDAGIVRFEENARVADDSNEITGALLVYDVAAKKIDFEGDSDAGERVQIIIQPPADDASDSLRKAAQDAVEDEDPDKP